MPARKSQFQGWYEQVKRELLVTEPQNILARSECCQNIINECISHMNMNLGLPAVPPSQQYSCAVVPTEHLKFLLDWPGLRVDNSPKAPKTKKEYEKKSKNWLNGRRAPNYGKTLFPFFIHDAERYLLATSKTMIKNDEEKQKLYYDIVIYKVLAQLCGCSVSLHEQAKKAPFFCKNSVERKGRLKEILQSYAADHEYIQGFPSCFEEAIGYFDRKSNAYFHQFRSEYLGYDKHCDDEEDDDSFLDDIPPPTSSRSRQQRIKSSPRSNNSSQYFNKRENRQQSRRGGGADAEYWKKQFMNLKRELALEHQARVKAEQERDNLKNLISTSAANNNLSTEINSNFGCSNGLPLTNDSSFDSINGSSTTTASTASSSICNGINGNNILSNANSVNSNGSGNNINNINNNNGHNVNVAMPALQPTTSYQSHSTHHTRSSGQQSPPMTNNGNNMQQNVQQNMSSMNDMNIGLNNMNNPSFQINHMHLRQNNMANNNSRYGPAIPPIVNNCTNNYFNNDMNNRLSSLKSNFMNNHIPQPITTSILPTSIAQNNNNSNNMMNNMNNINNMNGMNMNNMSMNINDNININNNNNNNEPALLFQTSANSAKGCFGADAFSTIIDTMPIMSRQQQVSDDSYPGFDSGHNGLSSPAPMYSFHSNSNSNNNNNTNNNDNNNNAVVTTTNNPF